MSSVLQQLRSPLQEELEAIEARSTTNIDVRVAEARKRSDSARQVADHWAQTLSDRLNDLSAALDRDIGRRIGAVRRAATDRINADDPAIGWPETQQWLTSQVNSDLFAHYALLRSQAAAIAVELNDQLASMPGASAVPLQIRDATAPTLSADDVSFSVASKLEMGILAARGSTVPIVLTHLVAGFATVAGTPLTGLGVVLAAALARRTFRGAKQTSTKAHQAEATRAVNLYLDGAHQLAQKDTAGMLRHFHRDFSDIFAGPIDEACRTALIQLESIMKVAQQDDAASQARRTQVKTTLAALDDFGSRLARVAPAQGEAEGAAVR
jgi:hypothetical protein